MTELMLLCCLNGTLDRIMTYKVLNFNNEVLGSGLSFDEAETLCIFNDDTTSAQFVVDEVIGETILSNINGHTIYRGEDI